MNKKLLKQIGEYKRCRNMEHLLEIRWLSMFYELLQFKKEYGHINVAAKSKKYPSLVYCVSTQRSRMKKLPKQKIALLESIGFEKPSKTTMIQF